MYAIDITGNVWRVDLDGSKSLSSPDFATVGKIASLSDVSHNRKFYNSLDISRSRARSGSDHYNLVVGSGYRANPRHEETYENRFYVLFDDYRFKRDLEDDQEDNRYNYFEYETSNGDLKYRQVVASDLVKSTFDDPATKFTHRTEGEGENEVELSQTINGFYVTFEKGEKILQSSITFDSEILFASYLPDGGTASACGGSLGSSRAYLLSLLTGLSVRDEHNEQDDEDDGNGGSNDDDENAEGEDLNRSGITVDPSVIIGEQLTVCFGTECKDFDWDSGKAEKTYWREEN